MSLDFGFGGGSKSKNQQWSGSVPNPLALYELPRNIFPIMFTALGGGVNIPGFQSIFGGGGFQGFGGGSSFINPPPPARPGGTGQDGVQTSTRQPWWENPNAYNRADIYSAYYAVDPTKLGDANRIFQRGTGGLSGRSRGIAGLVQAYLDRQADLDAYINQQYNNTNPASRDGPSSAQPPPIPSDLARIMGSGQATGESYINGKWVQTSGNPDLVYWGPTNQYYYKGVPVSEEQVRQMYMTGPPDMSPIDRVMGLGGLVGQVGRLFGPGAIGGPTTPPHIDPNSLGSLPSVSAPTFGGVPAIKPQQIEASLANFKDWGELQRSTYEAQARPALDELDRQEALATKQVMVQMAAFGGVDSPAALNALKTVRDDYGRRKEAVARDVSNAVTSSILGLKSQFELFNASQRQQANLANQAADLDAQKTYASLFTSGRIAEMQAAVEAGRTNMMGAIAQMQTQANIMIANADNYLRAIGLDFTREANLRNSFNDFMRIYATDRAMTFQNNLNAFNSFYNILMQGAGLATNLMDRTFGRSEQTTSMPTTIGASIYPRFGGSPYQDIERILDAYNKRQGTS